MKSYSDKVKFILDYVIIFGSLNEENQSYHYELSKDEKIDVNYLEETVSFIMFGEIIDTVNHSASVFTESQMEAIDLFYDNVSSKLGESQSIPEELSDLVREATLDAHKDWEGVTVVRDKQKEMGRHLRMRQIPITGSCFLSVKGYMEKHLYIIRFCTGEFYDVSDPSYERLFNRD